MAVMRSIFYVPGNNPKFIEKAPTIPADIITLDLEDAVPPSEKENARKMIVENMHKIAKESVSGAEIYVRINNWETEMTNDDLEAVVQPGLNGVTLAKTGHPDDVKRLAWKLEELERRRGMEIGSVKISMLLETAKGIMNAYECCMASPRNVNAIFGAVDYCRDMHVKSPTKPWSSSGAAPRSPSPAAPPALWPSTPPSSPSRTPKLSSRTCATACRWATAAA